MSDETVTMYDERGRSITIPRERWIAEVLPSNIEDAWNDAEALYELVVMGLQDDLADHVLDAATHLMRIDDDPVRASIVLAVAQMETDHITESEQTLCRVLDTFGENGLALTNLAKVYWRQGDDNRAEQTLRHGLHVEPNQDAGLEIWAALHEERSGEKGMLEALRDIGQEEGSWRPQMIMGVHFLRKGDVGLAIDMFGHAVRAASADGEALLTISSELGSAGCDEQIIDLLEPVYDPKGHGPLPGVNLVHAYQSAGLIEEAISLLRDIQRLHRPELAEMLANIERELHDQREPEALEPPTSLGIVHLTEPVWLHDLEGGRTVLPPSTSDQKTIGFFALADSSRAQDAAQVEQETVIGRLTRALPLYLAEATLFRTQAHTVTSIPILPQRAVVLSAEPWPYQAMLQSFEGGEKPDLLVSGYFAKTNEAQRLELEVWDVHDNRLMQRLTVPVQERMRGLAGDAERALLAYLLGDGLVQPRSGSGVFVTPDPPSDEGYLLALGELLVQVLTSRDLFSAESLWNERGMMETYFELADCMNGAPIPKLMAACGVLCGLSYDSPVVGHYLSALQQLIAEDSDPDSPLAKLGPQLQRRLAG